MQTKLANSQDFSWSFWYTLPIYPFGRRQTIRKEVVKDTVWTFDQIQGIFYVVVPVRMTVIRLSEGGLLVYAPVAPTPECIQLITELVEKYGDVKYIILPTISGLEHKVFVGPFARRFPSSQVFVAPGQWSFPVNLPLSWLGLPAKRTHVLPKESSQAPLKSEFEYAILGPIELGPGRFAEVAFFHKLSNTLLITDSIISIPEEPPAVVQLDPYPLLFHARDKAFDIVEDTAENRRKGWQRIALFAFYFRPSVLDLPKWSQVFKDALKTSNRSQKAYFGLYPFEWKPEWKRCFDALRANGRIFVAPILQALILNRAPVETLQWAEKIVKWDFKTIIPCHLEAPVAATPDQFRQAFAFLEKQPTTTSAILPEADFQVLRQIDNNLEKFKIVPPAKEKV